MQRDMLTITNALREKKPRYETPEMVLHRALHDKLRVSGRDFTSFVAARDEGTRQTEFSWAKKLLSKGQITRAVYAMSLDIADIFATGSSASLDQYKEWPADCPRLVFLDGSNSHLNADKFFAGVVRMSQIAHFQQSLEVLRLHSASQEQDISFLRQFRSLRTLELRGFTGLHPGSIASALAGHKQFEELLLVGCELREADTFGAIAKVARIVAFSCVPALDLAMVLALGEGGGVHTLSVAHCKGFDDKCMSALMTHPQWRLRLHNLHVTRCPAVTEQWLFDIPVFSVMVPPVSAQSFAPRDPQAAGVTPHSLQSLTLCGLDKFTGREKALGRLSALRDLSVLVLRDMDSLHPYDMLPISVCFGSLRLLVYTGRLMTEANMKASHEWWNAVNPGWTKLYGTYAEPEDQ